MGCLLTLLLSCDPAVPDIDDGTDRDSGTDSADTGDTGDTGLSEACLNLPPLPLVRPDSLRGFTPAEDFAFDGEGQHVSIDENGNLVGITYEGVTKLISAGFGEGAGTHMLVDGQIVIADVTNNTLVKVDPGTGGSVVLTAGLSYPNGLDVGTDAFVYVAESGLGTLRKVDAETGESSLIAAGMYGANGVSFGPGFDELYVASFGGGVVWRTDVGGDGIWTRPRVWALVPGAAAPTTPTCEVEPLGTMCTLGGGYGIGECVESELGYSLCETVPDTEACDGAEVGDPCETTAFGEPVTSICVRSSPEAPVFCPAAPASYVEDCPGNAGEACDVDGVAGTCTMNYEGTPICDLGGYWERAQSTCADALDGDDCLVDDYVYGWQGTCADGASWGLPGLVCMPGTSTGGEDGMLDGLNVDECGNVYATSYVAGKVWRWAGERGEPELVTDVRASWIPNLHWGNGVGGWRDDVLYMANRDNGSVYTLEVGIKGHGEAFVSGP
ncbi:MAG: hypothetical protein EXR71_11810 [Myxococcales bacterium]|nr:hypothetical protein [Myxococcales bacterium]